MWHKDVQKIGQVLLVRETKKNQMQKDRDHKKMERIVPVKIVRTIVCLNLPILYKIIYIRYQ